MHVAKTLVLDAGAAEVPLTRDHSMLALSSSSSDDEPQPTLPVDAVRLDALPPPERLNRPQQLSIASLLSPRRSPRLKIALACMTKEPNDMETWLSHHFELGVTRFYLRVESTPALKELFGQPPWLDCVHADFVEAGIRDNSSKQTDRQMQHLNAAIGHARADGFQLMLHVDDDELLYAPSGADALHEYLSNLPVHVCNAHALTIEAMMPTHKSRFPFREAIAFRHVPASYGSYGADGMSCGKSFGVLSYSSLSGDGPHHFTPSGNSILHPQRSQHTRVIPPRLAVTLHYESCDYSRWQRKFTEAGRHNFKVDEHRRRDLEEFIEGFADPEEQAYARQRLLEQKPAEPDDKKKGYMQRFYAQSSRACLAELAARESGDVVAIEKAAAEALSVWEAWRLQPPDLPCLPEGQNHLALSDRGITLIRPPGSRLKQSNREPATDEEAQLHALIVEQRGLPLDVSNALLAAAAKQDDGEAPASRVLRLVRLRDRAALDELCRSAGLRVGHRLKVVAA